MSEIPVEPENFDNLWDFDDPAGTEARFRSLLDSAVPGSAVQVELLTQIARTQGLQRQFDSAHSTLDQAQALLLDSAPRPRIRSLLERGRVFNSSGHKPQASAQFLQAWQLARAAGEDFYAVDAAHMLAISEPPAEQIAWNLRAIEAAEQSTQPRARKWLGSLYNNLGWTLHDQGQPAQALIWFERAQRIRQAEGKPEETLIARWCVARCLRSLGRVDEALAEQQALAAEHTAAGTQDGFVEEELGECLLGLGRPDEARPHFARPYAALAQDSGLLAGDPARLARLKQLSEAPKNAE